MLEEALRVLVMALLAGPAMLLATVALLGPYCGRGAGAVELAISACLLAPAWAMALEARREGRGAGRALPLVLLLLPLLVLVGVFARAALNRRSDQNLATCSANLQALGAAVESWRQEHGRVPLELPDPVPTCPAAGRTSYALEVGGGLFTVLCRGDFHRRHFYDDPRLGSPDFPRFSSATGRVLSTPP